MIKLLLITNGKKPFLYNFYDRHNEQAKRLGGELICISSIPINRPHILQAPLMSKVKYVGMFEAILQGLNYCNKDDVVFYVEDDCIYDDDHFNINHELSPSTLYYHIINEWICPLGFYDRKAGICLHQIYGLKSAMYYNILLKMNEFNNGKGTSVEPVWHPDEKNKEYRTKFIYTLKPVSVDFRGYEVGYQQTWKPEGELKLYKRSLVFGDSAVLWQNMILNPVKN